MNHLKLTGTLHRELTLKKDKNGNDYYWGKITLSDGLQKAFFFFQTSYRLSMRLAELKINQEITLRGCWSKKEPQAFLATDFYLVASKLENVFGFEYRESEVF